MSEKRTVVLHGDRLTNEVNERYGANGDLMENVKRNTLWWFQMTGGHIGDLFVATPCGKKAPGKRI